jgi:hypothetical protein
MLGEAIRDLCGHIPYSELVEQLPKLALGLIPFINIKKKELK